LGEASGCLLGTRTAELRRDLRPSKTNSTLAALARRSFLSYTRKARIGLSPAIVSNFPDIRACATLRLFALKLRALLRRESDWKMLTLPAARPLSERDLIIRCDIVDTWLRTRCGGLIEAHRDLEKYRRYNSRLSYLHRTVSDFLKLPEIKSRILSGTAGTPFVPAQALMQSSVLYIKWVMYPSEPKTNHRFWASRPPVYFAEQGLRYAYFAELETQRPQKLMLEELDRVCNILLRGFMEPPYC